MKKILLFAVLLAPCMPSLMLGIESQVKTNEERKLELLEQRFRTWCLANGYDYHNMTTKQLDVVWGDMWSETDDFMFACDSVDSVLSISNMLNQAM